MLFRDAKMLFREENMLPRFRDAEPPTSHSELELTPEMVAFRSRIADEGAKFAFRLDMQPRGRLEVFIRLS